MTGGNGHRITLEDGGTAREIIDLSNPAPQQPGAGQQGQPGTAVQYGQMPPGGFSHNGSMPLGEDERAELVRRRRDDLMKDKMLASRLVYTPGMTLPPDSEQLRPEFDRIYRSELDSVKRNRRLARDADRELAADGWQPPTVAADLAAELAQPRKTYVYRIGGMAGWNHNTLVAGPRKTGKSQLEINLTAALSLSHWEADPVTGQALWTPGWFLGSVPCYMGGNLGYLNGEMDADDWDDCFRMLPPGSYDASRIRPLHCRGIPLPVITNPAAREWFITWLRDNRIEVLIIDTWGEFCAKNGVRNFNDDAETRVILRGLDEIKRLAGVASVRILIHMPHQDGTALKERFKGSGAVGDWADTLWNYVQPDPADPTRYLAATGRARVDMPETALGFDYATGLLRLESGNRVQRAKQTMREKILAAVAEAPGIQTEELKDATGGHRNTASATIRKMVTDKELRVEREGRTKHFYISDHSGAAR